MKQTKNPRWCDDCGNQLGGYFPCDFCGGEGYVWEEDYLDAGYARPNTLMTCSFCDGDGGIYRDDLCLECEL